MIDERTFHNITFQLNTLLNKVSSEAQLAIEGKESYEIAIERILRYCREIQNHPSSKPIDSDIICPFCGEIGFDAVGLKYHLENYCDIYQSVPQIS